MKGSQYLGHRKVNGVPPCSSPHRDLADTKRIASSASHCLEMWNQPVVAHPSQHTLSPRSEREPQGIAIPWGLEVQSQASETSFC